MEHISYLDDYIKHFEKNKKKPGTIKQYTSDLKQFVGWLESYAKKNLFQLNDTDLMAYTDHLTKKKFRDTTIKRHMSSINQFLVFYHINVDLLA
ncbi:MAG: site-specific integrase [Bacillota bacterium]